jgi:uncharacterized repeat protein (TIGR03803 family)
MKTLKRVAIALLLLSVQAGGAGGQTLTTLHSFNRGDGANPYAALVQGSDGCFYGTTYLGGTSNNGTVFRISASGSLTNLHSFFSASDGADPQAGLVQGSDGNFYGTASDSGPGNDGTVFRIGPSGNFTNLYSFSGPPSDGAYPEAALVQGSDGDFYGTTHFGGTSTNCGFGCGTVFRIDTGGSLTNLHSFNSSDGRAPTSSLVQGNDGNFYGTTSFGGTSTNCNGGCGTVFRIDPSGNLAVLYQFSGPDGAHPDYAVLMRASDGNFYGTTSVGGMSTNCNGGCGTVFRISPNGNFTNLYSFSGNDGAYPQAGLVQGSDGDFYGTTTGGGSTNCSGGCGTVFRISPSGSLTNLHSFTGGSGGKAPLAGLVQGSDGSFYGTTSGGGASTNCSGGCGTVFKLSVPLNPPANQISAIQLADTNVMLTIPSVAGETYQLQYRDSLADGDWTNVAGASVTNSIGALITLTNFGGALQPQGFYRFDITP